VEVENIRAYFSVAFVEDAPYDVGFLARYTFITTHPVGACTESHLQQILKIQQQFHRSIHYYYIMFGIKNLDTYYSTIQDNDTPPTLQDWDPLSQQQNSNTCQYLK